MIERESDRLLFRQWQARDIEPYAAYYADEELARYVGGVSGRPDAWRRMAALMGHWALRGFGYWAVEEKDTKHFVGFVRLWYPEGWPELELGLLVDA